MGFKTILVEGCPWPHPSPLDIKMAQKTIPLASKVLNYLRANPGCTVHRISVDAKVGMDVTRTLLRRLRRTGAVRAEKAPDGGRKQNVYHYWLEQT